MLPCSRTGRVTAASGRWLFYTLVLHCSRLAITEQFGTSANMWKRAEYARVAISRGIRASFVKLHRK